MERIVDNLKCSKKGACYFTLPKTIMSEMKLKPFMTAHMTATKDGIKISKFSKTINKEVDLGKETINMIKKIMKLEGHGSMDETVCNAINQWFNKNKKEQIVFIYPEDYFEGNYSLIDDYRKAHPKGLK